MVLCPSLTLHEAISRGGDYPTLKGDLAKSCLHGYYVTFPTRLATWPLGSPVFRLTICPSQSKSHPHSATHAVRLLTSHCWRNFQFFWSILVSTAGVIDESTSPTALGVREHCITGEEDMGVWRQAITQRWANEWLIPDQPWIAMLIYCTYFLFSSWLDRCMSNSYSLCVGAQKWSWDWISVDTSADSVWSRERKIQTCRRNE